MRVLLLPLQKFAQMICDNSSTDKGQYKEQTHGGQTDNLFLQIWKVELYHRDHQSTREFLWRLFTHKTTS
jgi:hypothetical protein